MYLTDSYGMSFYKLIKHKFSTNLETQVRKTAKNDHGESYDYLELKPNHVEIQARIDKQYEKWLAKLPTLNWYDFGAARTPRETAMAQAQIDGLVGWYNRSVYGVYL